MRARAFLAAIESALGIVPQDDCRVAFMQAGALPSAFAVGDLAAASIAAAGSGVARLAGERAGDAGSRVAVDRRLAAFWFATSIRPTGWRLPAPWDPLAGDYRARDGWIRLHTNAPHHRAAAERVLGGRSDRAGMATAVAGWDAADLEAAIVAHGGCAAEMRDLAGWAAHPQGLAIAAEPLIALDWHAADPLRPAPKPAPDRPLAGLRVLDLTRILAGPVATRFLAGYGASVLRIDPPGWDEPSLAPEVTLGKACARLDLTRAADRVAFEARLAEADVLVHGYRPDALARLGYDAPARRRIAPGLIDVGLDAYGWTGPWAGRRGFDSLVQMSAGIAAAGRAWSGGEAPVPLPVQALDHATGYLVAATVLRGVAGRRADGAALTARLSLARTAKLLTDAPGPDPDEAFAPEGPNDREPVPEATAWGLAHRLRPPLVVAGAPMRWTRPARHLGSDAPLWPD